MTKVTDHHAIIPTGIQNNLQYNQQQVYDSISVLLPYFMTIVLWRTRPIGKAADVIFKLPVKKFCFVLF
jgi:DNA topoisomerase-3